jgi:hypothetical protein
MLLTNMKWGAEPATHVFCLGTDLRTCDTHWPRRCWVLKRTECLRFGPLARLSVHCYVALPEHCSIMSAERHFTTRQGNLLRSRNFHYKIFLLLMTALFHFVLLLLLLFIAFFRACICWHFLQINTTHAHGQKTVPPLLPWKKETLKYIL